MKKWMKAIIALAIIGIAAAVVMYFFVYNKPHPDYENLKADFSVSAEQLYKEYSTENMITSEKYNGKTLEISGTVSSVETSDSTATIIFVFNQGDFGDEGIRVSLLNKFVSQAAALTSGTSLKIKGLCTGYNDTDVIIEKGSILNH